MKMVYTKADPKKLINLMLPGRVICDEARKVAAIFWLWLCITDDILENMNDQDFSKGIRDMHASLAASSAMEHNSTSQISFVTKLFRGVITMTEISGLEPVQQDQWRSNLITCVQEIAHAFELERPLLRLKERVELEDWMKLRVVTISARPFMVLAKASLRILGNMSPMGNPLSPDYQSFQYRENDLADDLTRLETTMQCVLGLQNDILGWEKDHKEGLNLNCVQILIAKSRSSNNVVCTRALNTAIEAHNQLVVSAISRVPKHFKLKDQSKVCVRGSIQSSTDSSVPSLVESSDNSEAASMDSTSCSSTNPHAHQMYQANTFGEYSIEEIDTLEIAQNHGEAVPQQKISLYSSRGVIKASLVAETLGTVTKNEEAEQVRKYVNVLLNMGNGMATWMIGSRRYAIKE
ncbi:hypothetical protein BDZ91DRAFT_141473 [Kalaharituber pfeilii]|nr:hypothetical protein BDZ91DRAFT_141473 [Kalaharituber pfeilii]